MNDTNLQTCSELYCLLNYFPQSYIDKLPRKLLELIKQNSNSKYIIHTYFHLLIQLKIIIKNYCLFFGVKYLFLK